MKSGRSVIVACLLAVIQPGLGLLYAGRASLAVAMPVGAFLLVGIAGWSRLVLQPWGMLGLLVILGGAWLASIVLAGIVARRHEAMPLSQYQRWYVYLGFCIATLSLNFLQREYRGEWFGFETYRLPSASMADTYLPGDFVITDSWAYRHDNAPQRGDVVVFAFSNNPSVNFVKRIIGMPGDSVEIRDGHVFINGTQLLEPYVMPDHNKQTAESNKSYQVPQNEYFLLGDNRDASNDSRWQGTVPVKNVIGRVEAIWLSYDAHAGLRYDRMWKPAR